MPEMVWYLAAGLGTLATLVTLMLEPSRRSSPIPADHVAPIVTVEKKTEESQEE